MGFFKSMMADLSSLVKGASDGSTSKQELDARLNAFKQLLLSLDFKWHKLEAEWRSASSVEENLKRTPLMRRLMMHKAKSVSKRMMMIGQFTNTIETLISVLEQAQVLRNHAEQMKRAVGDVAKFKSLSEKMSTLVAQNSSTLDRIGQLQVLIDEVSTQMATTTDLPEMKELNDLYDELEKLQALGETEKAKAVQAKITALMSGGSSLAIA